MARLLDRVRAFLNPQQQPAQRKRPISPERLDDMSLAMRSVIQAGYDSTAKTPENSRHWRWADYLAADASLHPAVRIELRSQSRYELNENNCYGYGMVETLVTDTIGSNGPRLQVTQFSRNINQQIEQAWMRWCNAVGYVDHLRTLTTSKIIDGEPLARFINNVTIEDPVQLDLQLIECDQLRSPQFELQVSQYYVDGVHLNRFSLPYAFDILRIHPGANYYTPTDYFAYDTYPQEQVIHYFKRRRAGQHRGVPEFATALPLFAFLRRFTLATVGAAETAASVSQVVETDAPIPEQLEEDWTAASFEKWLDTIPVDRNSATVLPNMWKLKQFAAEHPTTTYAMFKRELISEIGRTLCVPTNIATGDSAQSNYSSARFDWLGYERRVKREQKMIDNKVNDRVFAEWLLEASLMGAIPRSAANAVLGQFDQYGRRGIASAVTHSWYWDGLRDADQKEAADAQRIRLQNGSTHRAREYANQGLDIVEEDAKAAESMGLTVEEYHRLVNSAIFSNGNILIGEESNESSNQETEAVEEAATA